MSRLSTYSLLMKVESILLTDNMTSELCFQNKCKFLYLILIFIITWNSHSVVHKNCKLNILNKYTVGVHAMQSRKDTLTALQKPPALHCAQTSLHPDASSSNSPEFGDNYALHFLNHFNDRSTDLSTFKLDLPLCFLILKALQDTMSFHTYILICVSKNINIS